MNTVFISNRNKPWARTATALSSAAGAAWCFVNCAGKPRGPRFMIRSSGSPRRHWPQNKFLVKEVGHKNSRNMATGSGRPASELCAGGFPGHDTFEKHDHKWQQVGAEGQGYPCQHNHEPRPGQPGNRGFVRDIAWVSRPEHGGNISVDARNHIARSIGRRNRGILCGRARQLVNEVYGERGIDKQRVAAGRGNHVPQLQNSRAGNADSVTIK